MSFAEHCASQAATTRSDADNSKVCPEQPSEITMSQFAGQGAHLCDSSTSSGASLYQFGDKAKFSCSALRMVVSGISKALSGDAVVTAPTIHEQYEWLGKITVKAGKLEGPYYRKHRVYSVRGQLLASGHVLPWQVGRSWRFSELYSLLVEELGMLLDCFDLRVHYSELLASFPEKTWQGRNSQHTAEYRAAKIEEYVMKGIGITTNLLVALSQEKNQLTKKQRDRQRARNEHRQRQRQLRRELGGFQGRGSTQEGEGASSDDEEEAQLPRDPEEIEKELKEVLDLFVVRLLGVDASLVKELLQISNDLGSLISNTPALQTRVTKEFRVDPQQGL